MNHVALLSGENLERAQFCHDQTLDSDVVENIFQNRQLFLSMVPVINLGKLN